MFHGLGKLSTPLQFFYQKRPVQVANPNSAPVGLCLNPGRGPDVRITDHRRCLNSSPLLRVHLVGPKAHGMQSFWADLWG